MYMYYQSLQACIHTKANGIHLSLQNIPLTLEPFDSDHVSGGCAKGYDDQNINCFVADYGAYCEHLQRYHRTEQTLVCRPLSAVALLVVCLYRWSY